MKFHYYLKYTNFIHVLIYGMLSFLFITCNSKKEIIDPKQVCFEFYELNKKSNFGDLYYMDIPIIRQYFEYDSKKNEYTIIPLYVGITDSIHNLYIKLPVFKKGADKTEQNRFFARCTVADIEYLLEKYNSDTTTIIVSDFYVKEVNYIYSQYSKIKVPKILNQTNISIDGRGNYIEFILYKNEDKKTKYSCYYVRDTIFSNDNKRNYFKTLSQFDEHWYYKIVSDKE